MSLFKYKTSNTGEMIPHEIVERNAVDGVPLIKAWRQYLGLSQRELAEKAGMVQTSLARLESKKITPRTDTLRKLAKAMNLRIEQLEED